MTAHPAPLAVRSKFWEQLLQILVGPFTWGNLQEKGSNNSPTDVARTEVAGDTRCLL